MMAKFSNVEEWMAQVRPEHEALLRDLRSLILSTEPRFTEFISPWSAPTYTVDGADRCYLADHSKYVHLGLYNGASLPDPHGMIEGTGKRLRHIKVTALDDVTAARLREYVKAAATLDPSVSASSMSTRPRR